MLCSNPACGEQFIPTKKWQRFCSPACRGAGHQRRGTASHDAVRSMIEKLRADPAAMELPSVKSAIRIGRRVLDK